MKSKRERLARIDPEIKLADGFDSALIGVVEIKGRPTVALYDRQQCIDLLVERDGMTTEEAEEYFCYNVADAYVGERTPAFMYPLEPNPETVEVTRESLEFLASMVCQHRDAGCMDSFGPYPPCGEGAICNSCAARQFAEGLLDR